MHIIWALWLLAFKPPAKQTEHHVEVSTDDFVMPNKDEIKKNFNTSMRNNHPDKVHLHKTELFIGARVTVSNLQNKKEFNNREAIVLSTEQKEMIVVGMHYDSKHIIIKLERGKLTPIPFDATVYQYAAQIVNDCKEVKTKPKEEEAKGNEEEAKGKEKKKRKLEKPLYLEVGVDKERILLIDKDLNTYWKYLSYAQLKRVNKGPVCIGSFQMQKSSSGANNTVLFGVPYHNPTKMPDLWVQQLDAVMDARPHDLITLDHLEESGQWVVKTKCKAQIMFTYNKKEIKTELNDGDTHVLNPFQLGNENPLFGKFVIKYARNGACASITFRFIVRETTIK